MAELRCEGLTKAYAERRVLRGVDLLVEAGTLTAILGASGSGKTTLLRVLMGLVQADAGTVAVGGSIVADGGRVNVRTDKRSVGYVAQEGALFPHLDVAGNVGFGLSRRARKEQDRIVEVLELVGMDRSYSRRRPHELSGGEQRRVALARALAPRPRLVLLDEPFSGLDAALRIETREAVVHALAGEGATAVLVTHDQAEALSMGREVAVLREGQLIQRTAPAALYRTPVDLELARFMGEAVVLPGESSGGRVACALGELEIHAPSIEGPVAVMLRPEQIRLTRLHERALHGHGALARVVGHTYYGPDTFIRLALESDPGIVVKTRTFSHDVPETDELVDLLVRDPVVVYPLQGQPDERLSSAEEPIRSSGGIR